MSHWPHAPNHSFNEKGTYMVTAATYQQQHYFNTPNRLDFLHNTLLTLAKDYGWNLQAWAILTNHYHFVAQSPENPKNLNVFISHLHTTTAQFINEQDNQLNRKVWHQFWDTHLTFQQSYLARLNYVHQNPVKHGVAASANLYPWCSASWFENLASVSFRKSVERFKIDKLNIQDDF